MIPQRNLSLLSNRLTVPGARRIPEEVLERDYCIAWFLAILSQSDLNSALAFKGGTALRRCYFNDYRFSEDLDFTLMEVIDTAEIKRRFEAVYARIREQSGIVFAFDREDRHGHTNSFTFYLRYEGPLPRGDSLKVDKTLREHVVFPLPWRPVLRGHNEYADLPKDCSIQTYSLEEIVAEKVMALSDKARNEPRDLYDFGT